MFYHFHSQKWPKWKFNKIPKFHFEWKHHTVSSTDSEVRTTKRNSLSLTPRVKWLRDEYKKSRVNQRYVFPCVAVESSSLATFNACLTDYM